MCLRRNNRSFLLLLAICAFMLMICGCNAARADVIDFEDGFDSLFNYQGVDILDGSTYSVAESGYRKMANITPGNMVSFDPFAVSPSIFTWANPLTTFNLDSMLIGGAWGTQTLTLEGYKGGNLLFTDSLFVGPDPQAWSPEWQDLDEFRILTGNDFTHTVEGGNGQHWVMDNLVVETCDNPLGGPGPSPVPEPGTMSLLGMGAVGMVAKFRRRKNGQLTDQNEIA